MAAVMRDDLLLTIPIVIAADGLYKRDVFSMSPGLND